jgi:riboflavin kinase/FMN adenylyltransferase
VQLEEELAGFSQYKDSIVTIGVFDGVHLGHKYLISQLKKLARERDLRTIAITFRQHPQEILTPKSQPPFLIDIAEKTRLLKNEGLDSVIVLSFTPDLAQLSAREFVTILHSKLRMKGLVVGPDFALGRNHEGGITALRQLGSDLGFSVTVIPPVTQNGDVVSSTAIRLTLARGDMEKVHRLLGRPFSLHGGVVSGKGRGSGLGFPTVNLNIQPNQALPADGVYATRANIENKVFDSVTNIGTNPTFGKNKRTVEAFLLDFHDNLYGREVRVDFIHRLRGEIKFGDAEHLKNQITEDVQLAKIILNTENEVSYG